MSESFCSALLLVQKSSQNRRQSVFLPGSLLLSHYPSWLLLYFVLKRTEVLDMRLPANVAEVLPTLAHDVLAAIDLLHPEATVWTSFESTPRHELLELLVLWPHFHIHLVLFARHALVPVSATLHAVV